MAETPFERDESRFRPPAVVVRARGAVARWEVALGLILLLGLALRLHGINWDQPSGAQTPLQMHPDERFLSLVSDRLDWPDSIGGYFDTGASPLNPYNDPETHSYVYGTFPLFLAKGAATMAGRLPDSLLGIDLPDEYADRAGPGNSYDKDILWGRRITALFDTATIALVFALGTTLFSRKVGLLGALLYALAVLPTQLAHFWTMDPYVTFFGASTLLIAAKTLRDERKIRRPALRLFLLFSLLGSCIGLGLASKVTAWPLLLAPGLAVAMRIAIRDVPRLGLRWHGERPALHGHWTSDISFLCVSIAFAMVVFRIAQPYAFAGPNFWDMNLNPTWRADIEREIDFQNGNVDYPPFVQFAGRSPFLTPLRNIVLWGLGPALGIAAIVSVVAAGVVLFRRRELTFLMPLAFAGAVFVFQGPRFVAFMRYFEPIYPVLCLMAAWGLLELWQRRKSFPAIPSRVPARIRPSPRVLSFVAAAAVFAVVGASAFWAFAFQSIYTQEHPRIAASEWLYDNALPGARITGEIWDDTLPYGLPNRPNGEFKLIETEPYTTDSLQKVDQLIYGRPDDKGAGGLVNADYVAISSNRVKDSIARLPAEYPAMIRYYQLLDSGELGFKRVAHFQVRPTFLGLSINDASAEESFTVYDHPEVTIYQKTLDFDAQKAKTLLNGAQPERAVNLLPRQGRTNGLQFTPEEAKIQQSGGTFTDVFDADGLASHLPWLWWLLWLEIAAFAAFPWVSWLFRALPDRGYGLSKLLGLGAIVLPTWALVAWGGPHFSGGLVWTVSGVAVVAGLGIGIRRRRALREDIREHWHSWLALELAFLGAFAAFLLLRYFNPDLWHHPQGGEKPMEIAYLTAVTRSTTMPPYDPWFAGGSMNYYYMGWFFLAVPIRALKLLPEVAFNLGIPTFAALGVSVAFSTVHNLVGIAARARTGVHEATRIWRRPAIAAGFFGAILLTFMANLDGAHQTIERFQAVNTWGAASGTPVLGGAVGILGGLWQFLVHGASLPPFDWWRSSRVHFGQFDITEFPFWSLLFADLHPHLMGVPFFGLVIALAVAYIVTVQASPGSRAWILAALLGLAVGLVRTVHTWDFPTAALIAGAAIPLAQLLAPGRWQTRFWNAIAHLALAGLVASVVFAPYTAHFETFDPGVIRAPETTQAHQFFVQYGIFIAIALAFIAVRYREVLVARNFDHGRNPVLATVNGRWELLALAVFTTGLGAFTWAFGLTTLALAAIILIFLLNLLWLEIRAPQKDLPRTLGTTLFILGFGIAAGTDVVTLKNDIVRMNTVFKFSLQAWQCFALAGGFGAWYVMSALWEVRGSRALPRPGRRLAAWSAAATFGLLLFGSSIFLWSGTAVRQDQRFNALSPTLDGLAFLNAAVYPEDLGDENPANDRTIRLEDDEPLIRWLRQNVQGSPVIVEAVGPLYHWTGRISEYTGLPAVIGWDWHQIQQRTDYTDLIQQRRADTARFYRDPSVDVAASYLLKYNVTYIVVGTEEVAWGTPGGLAKMTGLPGVSEVFRLGEYAIYRVDQSALPIPR